MGRTTNVNYEVIDECITEINRSINDYHVRVEIGQLQQSLINNVGNVSDELRETARELSSTYQILINMMFEMKDTLTIAKKMFADTDTNAADSMNGGS